MKKNLLFSLLIWSTVLVGQVPYVITETDVLFENGEIKKYYGLSRDIIIPPFLYGQEVTSLGEISFTSSGLTSVQIPNTVTNIGVGAFYINDLETITIPESVTNIDDYAFSFNDLKNLDLPSSITHIGAHAFMGNAITSIAIPENITQINPYAFSENKLMSIEFLGDITIIKEHAFSNNELSSLELPSTLNKIGASAFLSNKLNEVTIPNTVTVIGDNAFSYNLLTSVTLPNNLKKIHAATFYDNLLTSITIPETVNYIGANAFRSNALTEVSIPNTVYYIGNYAFSGNTLTEFTLPTPTIVGQWNTNNSGDNVNDLIAPYFYLVENYTTEDTDFKFADGVILNYFGPAGDVIIPETINNKPVKAIGERALSFKNLNGITLPNSLKRIEKFALWFNQIDNIILPESLVFIGEYAFNNNLISEATIPNTVLSIGQRAFDRNQLTQFRLPIPNLQGHWNTGTSGQLTNKLNVTFNYMITGSTPDDSYFTVENGAIIAYSGPAGDLIIPEVIDNQTITSIGDDTFREKNLNSVVLPQTLTSIGDNAFLKNNLTSVIVPNSVTHVGNSAFFDNNISSLVLSDNTEVIDDYAFSYNSLASISFPSSLTYIGRYAFETNKITNLQIPNTITYVGASAFENNKLTQVTIPSSLNKIENGTFASNELVSVTIPNSITSIGHRAFARNMITNVVFSESTKFIGHYAFQNNNLTTVQLPNTVTAIGTKAFHLNPNMTSFKLPSPPIPDGYTADGWLASNDVIYNNEEITTDLINNYKVNFTSYEGVLVSLLFEDNTGNISVTGDHIEYNEDISCLNIIVSPGNNIEIFADVPQLPTGYELNHNLLELKDIQENRSYMLSTQAKIYAITYHNIDEQDTYIKSYTIEDETIVLPVPQKEDHEFEGWYTDDTYNNPINEITSGSHGDIEAYAKFTEISDVTLSSNTFENNSFSVYPNPSNGEFTVVTNENEVIDIAIYSPSGDLIKTLSNQSKQTVNLNLNSGVYYINIRTNNANRHSKLIIK